VTTLLKLTAKSANERILKVSQYFWGCIRFWPPAEFLHNMQVDSSILLSFSDFCAVGYLHAIFARCTYETLLREWLNW